MSLHSMLKIPTRLWPSGQQWNEYNEIVAPGIPLSAVMSRDYWIHVQNNLRPNDVINVVASDGSFDARIRVLSKTGTAIKFRLIHEAVIAEREAIVTDQDDRYVVKPPTRGAPGLWKVQDKQTGQVIADGLDKDGAEAEKARLENERKAA